MKTTRRGKSKTPAPPAELGVTEALAAGAEALPLPAPAAEPPARSSPPAAPALAPSQTAPNTAETAPSDAQLTPAMRQWSQQKQQIGDALLLFRMGDFYELFNDDAPDRDRGRRGASRPRATDRRRRQKTFNERLFWG